MKLQGSKTIAEREQEIRRLKAQYLVAYRMWAESCQVDQEERSRLAIKAVGLAETIRVRENQLKGILSNPV